MNFFHFNKRQKQILLFGGGLLVYLTLNMQRVAIPGTIFNELQRTFHASASALANLSTGFMCAYAIAQLPAGIFVDRYGGMKVLLYSGISLTIGALLFPFAKSYLPLYLSRIFMGFGGGFIYLSIVKETNRLFPKNFSAVMGLVFLFGYAGAFLATTPLVKLTHALGWRYAMLIFGILCFFSITIILLLWHTREPIARSTISYGIKNYKKAFLNSNNLKLIFTQGVNFGLYYVILTIFGKKFLEDIIHLSPTVASICCAFMVIIPAIGNQFTGTLSMKLGNKRRPFIRLASFFPFLSSLLFLTASLPIIPGFLCGYLFTSSFLIFSIYAAFGTMTSSIAREVNPAEETGIGVGIVNFSGYMMVAIWGTVVGLILDLFKSGAQILTNGTILYPNTAYQTIFIIFLIVTAFAFWLSLKIPETNGKNIYSGKEKTYHFFRFIKITLHS
ncbi:MAG: MFS transporter [Lentisphaeria bacterium]